MLAIDIIMGILMALTGAFGLFFGVIAIWGSLRKAPECPRSAPQKRIVALIAARNESGVIAPLIKSVLAQNYPRELMDAYVIPNNCTDDTEQVARAAGARILNCNIPVHAKGEAISWAIDALLASDEHIDGFVILDADNLVDPEYFQCANDALCAGAQVAQGRRDSKNYSDSWVAGCTSEFYWAMNRFYNHARCALHMSAALNGTGILLSADYMRKVGWHTSSLTEDLEFTAQCALNGVRIWWLDKAIAYDEQPIHFMDSFRQRRRWSAGTVQCMRGYMPRLLKRAVCQKKLQCLDMAVLFSGPLMQLFSLIPGIYFFFRTLFSLPEMEPAMTTLWLASMVVSALGSVIVLSAASALLLHVEHKPLRGQWGTVFGLWLFLLSWIPANLLSLFTKPPKWVQIAHTRGLSLEDVEKENSSGDAASQKGRDIPQ